MNDKRKIEILLDFAATSLSEGGGDLFAKMASYGSVEGLTIIGDSFHIGQEAHNRAIYNAAIAGKIDALRRLIPYGEVPEGCQDECLSIVLKNGNNEVFDCLFNTYKSIYIGNHTMYQALKNDDVDIYKKILERIDLSEIQLCNNLCWACEHGSPNIVKYLVEETCADHDHEGGIPLKNAARNGNYEVAKILIEHDAIPTFDSFRLAIIYGYAEIAELLYTAGLMDIDHISLNQMLHMAFFYKEVDTIKYLISLGAEFDTGSVDFMKYGIIDKIQRIEILKEMEALYAEQQETKEAT